MNIVKSIDHNTTFAYIDGLQLAFHRLFDRLPKVIVTGTFQDLKTGELIFVNYKECEILRQRKTGKAIFEFENIDGEKWVKATIENDEQKNILNLL